MDGGAIKQAIWAVSQVKIAKDGRMVMTFLCGVSSVDIYDFKTNIYVWMKKANKRVQMGLIFETC